MVMSNQIVLIEERSKDLITLQSSIYWFWNK